MRKFVFRLETLRRFRAAREKTARREYAEAKAAYEAELERLQILMHEEGRGRGSLKAELSGPCRPERLTAHQEFLACKAMQIEGQRLRVLEAYEELERKRAELAEASKEHKVVERLYEQQKARHDFEMLAEEQKLMDEVAGTRFISDRSDEAERGIA